MPLIRSKRCKFRVKQHFQNRVKHKGLCKQNMWLHNLAKMQENNVIPLTTKTIAR